MTTGLILVTGGTGTLGRDLVPLLESRGADVAVLSRHAGNGIRVADLESGVGLEDALVGVDTVIHLAAGKHQAEEAQNLVTACESAGIRHLVFISIVGIDLIPYPYYVAKRAAEEIIEASTVPSTIFRTTQFHQFVIDVFFAPQRRLPVVFAPSLSIQPIDTRVVAGVLADAAFGEPRGRLPDLGGPEVLTGRELATLYAPGKRVLGFALFGRIWRAFAAGHQLAPTSRAGGRTFADFLAEEPPQ